LSVSDTSPFSESVSEKCGFSIQTVEFVVLLLIKYIVPVAESIFKTTLLLLLEDQALIG